MSKVDPLQTIVDYIERRSSNMNSLFGLMGYEGVRTVFFEPNKEFLDWIKSNFGDKILVDCGAGVGKVTSAIRGIGVNCLPIDVCPSAYSILEVLNIDSVHMAYNENTIALICRPSRGNWVHATICKSVEESGKAIYCGREKHYDEDLEPLPYKITKVMSDIGPDNDCVWLIEKE
jgi:hypothetical protein